MMIQPSGLDQVYPCLWKDRYEAGNRPQKLELLSNNRRPARPKASFF